MLPAAGSKQSDVGGAQARSGGDAQSGVYQRLLAQANERIDLMSVYIQKLDQRLSEQEESMLDLIQTQLQSQGVWVSLIAYLEHSHEYPAKAKAFTLAAAGLPSERWSGASSQGWTNRMSSPADEATDWPPSASPSAEELPQSTLQESSLGDSSNGAGAWRSGGPSEVRDNQDLHRIMTRHMVSAAANRKKVVAAGLPGPSELPEYIPSDIDQDLDAAQKQLVRLLELDDALHTQLGRLKESQPQGRDQFKRPPGLPSDRPPVSGTGLAGPQEETVPMARVDTCSLSRPDKSAAASSRNPREDVDPGPSRRPHAPARRAEETSSAAAGESWATPYGPWAMNF